MRVVHRHSSSATIYSANWSLLRWSLATLNALAVDDISRKRQAPIIESAISVCVQGLDLDAQGDGFGSPAVPDARHAVAEAASLIWSMLHPEVSDRLDSLPVCVLAPFTAYRHPSL